MVLFAAAGFLSSKLILISALFLVFLLLASAIVVRWRKLNLQATRTFHPATVEAGSAATVTLVVTNLGNSRSAAASWRDALPWSPGFTDRGKLESLVAHRERYSNSGNMARLDYRLTPPRRGIFEIGPLSVEATDPFGLVSGAVDLAGTHGLVVTPRVELLPGSGISIDAGDGASRIVQRSAHGSEDDLMTREYRRGDALRRVHWRASARHGELMVRQEEPRNRPEARIILDTRIDGYGDIVDGADDPRSLAPESAAFEWVVSLVASVGLHLDRGGYAVTVIESAGHQLEQPGEKRGMDATDSAFLDSLAGARLVRELGDEGDDDRAANRPDAALAPIFAIVASPQATTLEWMARHRRPYERGIAIVLDGGDAIETFDAAGWTCVSASLDDSPAAVWAAATRGSAGASAGRQS